MAKAKRTTTNTKRAKAPAKVPSLLEALDRAQELHRGALAMLNATSGDILEAAPLGWVAHRLANEAETLAKIMLEIHTANRKANPPAPL
jgi:hypothetical protein